MKGILFDLDGVIADTSVYHFAAWCQLIKQHFGKDLPADLEEQTKGVSREMSLQLILKAVDVTVTAEEFKALAEEKNALYLESLEDIDESNILPGIQKFITECKANKMQLALASSSKNGPIILKKLGIIDQFDAIVDPGSIKHGKPAPDIFLAAAKAIDVIPVECIGVEDAVAGVNAINSAGIFSVAVGGEELSHANYRVESTNLLHLTDILTAINC